MDVELHINMQPINQPRHAQAFMSNREVVSQNNRLYVLSEIVINDFLLKRLICLCW